MIVSPRNDPALNASGWLVLVSGVLFAARALSRPALSARVHARNVADALLGGGLMLLGVDLGVGGLAEVIRLPLVVGSLACTASSLVVRRTANTRP
ncbi:MAG: hypothetical protein ACREK8_06670 [Gemmatimonadales bacterium]